MSEELNREYQVSEEIGRGRFGVVYRCFSHVSGGWHAVKSIEKRLIADDSLDAQCLLTEPKILQLLSSHPNIIKLYDLYEDDTHLHMVLDLCSSADLHHRVVTRLLIPEPEAASVMVQLFQALLHCHTHGVAHRDIKPENILFDDRNRLKLADFGSAEFFKDEQLMTSAGVVLYIMLAGFPPFYGDSAVEIFDAVLRANLRFPARAFQSVSPAVKDLLRRMLCKDVSRRFSADQVLRHPWITSGGSARTHETGLGLPVGNVVVRSALSRSAWGGGFALPRSAWGGGFALPRSAWGGGFALVGLRWVWVFAKAHQLKDLFMEPWVEAHV
uniref:Protein kinase domain-containing protein n=1 Tax=Fagus sylvatica TaxID=28930 RepID=A0A2N9GMY3_FAGSY